MSKNIIILSGGMDSVTLLYYLIKEKKENLLALSFDYGSNHNSVEIPLARINCEKLKIKHKVLDLKEIFNNFESALLGTEDIPEGHYEDSNMKNTVVPFRNGIFLSIAAGFAENNNGSVVYYGAHSGDHAIYPDCREDFRESLSKSFSLGTYKNVKIECPFIKMNKINILKKGIELEVPYGLTHTCYSPSPKREPCGKCGSCVERTEAFIKNNTQDPRYSSDENWDKAVYFYNQSNNE